MNAHHGQDCARICANKVVACVRLSTLLRNIRPQDTLQFTRARDFNQLDGLAVAIPWGFESPLPHHSIRLRFSPKRGDNTFYVGHTDDVASRLHWHRHGLAANHTALRLPVDLAHTEELPSMQAALQRERQLKRWSADKKAALIAGNLTPLK